ncbi:hypothetical protein N7451_012224 [Penicillium sp. IBT 35674x]|nr:hypothetical protein N7451_012224 [Penicillium sp. IBT 35674x]
MPSVSRISSLFQLSTQFELAGSRNLASRQSPRSLRGLHSIVSGIRHNGCSMPFKPIFRRAHIHPTTTTAQSQSQILAFSSTSPTATSSDNLIEELQGLHTTAKELLEIARDSVGKDTVYAASDLECVRDALNQLTTVYELYTTGEKGTERCGGDGATEAGQPGPIVSTSSDAGNISDTVRADVIKRFGQKVLDLTNAVEVLEENDQVN